MRNRKEERIKGISVNIPTNRTDMTRSATLNDILEWHMKSRAYTDKANLKANIAIALSFINIIAILGMILFTL